MKFGEIILSYGFIINQTDECLYHKVDGNNIVILCLYVDDILIFGSDMQIK